MNDKKNNNYKTSQVVLQTIYSIIIIMIYIIPIDKNILCVCVCGYRQFSNFRRWWLKYLQMYRKILFQYSTKPTATDLERWSRQRVRKPQTGF